MIWHEPYASAHVPPVPGVSLVSVTAPRPDDEPLLTVAVQVVESPTVSEAGWQLTVVVVDVAATAANAQKPSSASVAPRTKLLSDAERVVQSIVRRSERRRQAACQRPFGWRTT